MSPSQAVDGLKMLSVPRSLGRDVNLLIASMGIISLAGGFSAVAQAIYLALIGLTPAMIGLLASISIVSGALRMVAFSYVSDRFGRKKVLFSLFLTSALYYVTYASATDYGLFVLAGIIGGAGGEGFGGYVEAALLAEKAGESKRTTAFSLQYFVASSLSAVGAFAAGLPEALVKSWGIQLAEAIRMVFGVQAVLALASSGLILLISDMPPPSEEREVKYLDKEARKRIVKLSFIGLFDGFGIGMIAPLFSLWFYLRFGIGVASVGQIFTISKLLETITYLLSAPMGRRLGLIRAISIVRLGGAISVGLTPFMPTYWLAAVAFTSRNVIQHISLPLRQSYVMAIFNSKERASAGSLSNLTNTAGSTIATALSGYVMETIGTTISPIISALFVGTASQLYRLFFRDIKPPEESVVHNPRPMA